MTRSSVSGEKGIEGKALEGPGVEKTLYKKGVCGENSKGGLPEYPPTSSTPQTAVIARFPAAAKPGRAKVTAFKRSLGISTHGRAIRAKCLDCSGGFPPDVRNCVIPSCPLYPFRLGRSPRNLDDLKVAQFDKMGNLTGYEPYQEGKGQAK